MENQYLYEGWRGFREGSWVHEIDLRSFIRHNFTIHELLSKARASLLFAEGKVLGYIMNDIRPLGGLSYNQYGAYSSKYYNYKSKYGYGYGSRRYQYRYTYNQTQYLNNDDDDDDFCFGDCDDCDGNFGGIVFTVATVATVAPRFILLCRSASHVCRSAWLCSHR